MKKIPALLMLSLTLAALSCFYSLEEVINNSRHRVTVYGNDMYWQGLLVGRREELTGSRSFEARRILEASGAWPFGFARCARTVSQYNSRTKQMESRTEYYARYSEISSAYTSFDLQGRHKTTVIDVSVPTQDCGTIHRVFVHNGETRTVSEFPTRGGSGFGEEGWGRLMAGQMRSYPPKRGYAPGEDPLSPVGGEEFEMRKRISLKEGTDESTRFIHVQAGMNAFYYHRILERTPAGAHSDLRVNVKPIYLTYAAFDIALPFMFFKGRYQTDFGRIGGSVETGGEARDDFGINGRASYMLDLAAGLAGVELKFSAENYKFGRGRYYTSTNPAIPTRDVRNDILFEMKTRQADVIYHPLWRDIPRLGGTARRTRLADIYFGYRYLKYTSPRMYYTEIDEEGHPDEGLVIGESTPQMIAIQGHCLGAGLNNYLTAERKGMNLVYSAELYAGYGWTRIDMYDYYYNPSYISPQEAAAGDNDKRSMGLLSPGGSLGLMYNFSTGAVKTSVKLEYFFHAYLLMTSRTGEYAQYFNSHLDYFHSVALSFDALF